MGSVWKTDSSKDAMMANGAFRYGEVGTHAEGKWRIGNVLKWPESIPIMKKRNPYGSTIKCKKRRPEEQKVKAKWS